MDELSGHELRKAITMAIKRELLDAGITALELARMANIDSSTLYRKLSCKSEFSAGELVAISRSLGVDTGALLAGASSSPVGVVS
jgi:predicted transcriptional regulator